MITEASQTSSWRRKPSSSREVIVRSNVYMQILPILLCYFYAFLLLFNITSTFANFSQTILVSFSSKGNLLHHPKIAKKKKARAVQQNMSLFLKKFTEVFNKKQIAYYTIRSCTFQMKICRLPLWSGKPISVQFTHCLANVIHYCLIFALLTIIILKLL